MATHSPSHFHSRSRLLNRFFYGVFLQISLPLQIYWHVYLRIQLVLPSYKELNHQLFDQQSEYYLAQMYSTSTIEYALFLKAQHTFSHHRSVTDNKIERLTCRII